MNLESLQTCVALKVAPYLFFCILNRFHCAVTICVFHILRLNVVFSFLKQHPGVTHQDDVPYVWGYPFLPRCSRVMEDSQLYMPDDQWTKDDVKFSAFMQTVWTNFAKFG